MRQRWKTFRHLMRSKIRCCLDQVHEIRWRVGALRSAIELYVAIGRRGRSGIHVYWSSLNEAEQSVYARELRRVMNEIWHIANRKPDVKP